MMHRDVVASFCNGYGLDLGSGGESVTPAAIRLDQLGRDCRDLGWFRDGVLDYVYSSHVLEDFEEDETESILREWSRVLRTGGHLLVLIPDRRLDNVREAARRIEPLDPTAEVPEPGESSVLAVLRRIATAEDPGAVDGRLRAALSEVDDLEARLRKLERQPIVRWASVYRRLRRSRALPASETSKHRDVVASFCTGHGLDVGFGGDPVTPAAIRMDLPSPYTGGGDSSVQLGGDCRDLGWFRDGVLDYVYSSHVLEDFEEDETESILREWSRVLRTTGQLVLLLPDQQRYLRHCAMHGVGPNPHHSIDRFSLEYVKTVVGRVANLEASAELAQLGDYSFLVMCRKTGAIEGPADARLRATLSERDELEDRLRKIERHPAVRLVNALGRTPARH